MNRFYVTPETCFACDPGTKWKQACTAYFVSGKIKELKKKKKKNTQKGVHSMLVAFNKGNEHQIFKHFIQSFSKYFSTNLVHYVLTYFHSIDVHELNPKLN